LNIVALKRSELPQNQPLLDLARTGLIRDAFGNPAPCQSLISTSPSAPAGRRI
jgi:hypothetical protein